LLESLLESLLSETLAESLAESLVSETLGKLLTGGTVKLWFVESVAALLRVRLRRPLLLQEPFGFPLSYIDPREKEHLRQVREAIPRRR